jgi:anti-sigma factor RsiW
MRHLRARRHLASLHDGTLSEALDAEVRRHAADCPRCSRILAEYAAIDELLLGLPASLLPPTPSRAAEARLGLLARLARRRTGPWFERLPIHPLGAVTTAAALLLTVFLLTPPFVTESAEPFNAVVLAKAPPASDFGIRPGHGGGPARSGLPLEPSETYLLPVAVH